MRKSVVLGFFLLFSFLFVSLVSAVTLVTPATSSVVSGASVSWNVTNISGSLIGMTNCSIYLKSPSTANTTYSNLSVATNTSANIFNITGTFNSVKVQDSVDYSIYASCGNTTATLNSSVSTITIDNTIPTAPSSLSPTAGTLDTDGTINFSATVIGANTTSCTLQFSGINPGATSYTMTHSGNLCYLQQTAIPTQTYSYNIVASDGTNTSTSSTLQFNINTGAKTSSNYLFTQGTEKQQALTSTTSSGGPIPTWVIVILVIIIIALIIKSRK